MMTQIYQLACYIARHGESLPGHWRLLRWLQTHEAELAKLGQQKVSYGSFRMQVDPADENGRQVMMRGMNRKDRVVQHIQRLLRRGDAMLDIGANCGYMSFAAAERVGPRGEIIAFEPSPLTGELLEKNISLNPQANIEPHHVAVGQQSGKLNFHSVPQRSGYSSLRAAGRPAEEVSEVEVIALDDWLERLPAVRLIKLDIEGAELMALRGARALLDRDRPYLIIEVDDTFLRELNGSAAELCELLQGAGYELERIGPGGSLATLERPPLDRCNLLATPIGNAPSVNIKKVPQRQVQPA